MNNFFARFRNQKYIIGYTVPNTGYNPLLTRAIGLMMVREWILLKSTFKLRNRQNGMRFEEYNYY